MNDAEYLFKQQEITTKRIARGAFSKKRGGGKHCRLPSDNLTKAQRNKLNGEPMAMNMNEPTTWDQLKKFPQDIQRAYIEGIRDAFDPTNHMLADLLGLRATSLAGIIARLGIPSRKGYKPSPKMEAWELFRSGQSTVTLPVDPLKLNVAEGVINVHVDPQKLNAPEDLPAQQQVQLLDFCRALRELGATSFSFSVQF